MGAGKHSQESVMVEKLSSSVRRVQAALDQYGLGFKVVEMPQSTRTAEEAADAVGCRVGQIVKSMIFKGSVLQRAILVATSGANRVHEKKVGEFISEKLMRADPEFVREQTGFAIGGVAPVGHIQPVLTLIDQDLLQYDEIWAAAGTPKTVFKLTPQDLQKITNGKVIPVT
jgi:prolyl-tRNA editing enzyme YbaK/EbsC (Cys-tRNA(Pro) deacylase)